MRELPGPSWPVTTVYWARLATDLKICLTYMKCQTKTTPEISFRKSGNIIRDDGVPVVVLLCIHHDLHGVPDHGGDGVVHVGDDDDRPPILQLPETHHLPHHRPQGQPGRIFVM